MEKKDIHFFVTVLFFVVAVFLLDLLSSPEDVATGAYVYEEAARELRSSPATDFSLRSLKGRMEALRYTKHSQTYRCKGECDPPCLANQECLPVSTKKREWKVFEGGCSCQEKNEGAYRTLYTLKTSPTPTP